MSGETPRHEEEDFVAPDESRRVESSETAEEMARDKRTLSIRNKAATNRSEAGDMRKDPLLKRSMSAENIEAAAQALEKPAQDLDALANDIEEQRKRIPN